MNAQQIRQALQNRELLFLDGAFGTSLQAMGLGGHPIPEEYNLTNPQAVIAIHEGYARAGAQILYANTFGANPWKLETSQYTLETIIQAAIRNARVAAENAGSDAAVFLDIGPCGRMLEPNGSLSFEEAYEGFARIVRAGVDAGADGIILETLSDLQEARAALLAAKENSDLPVFVSLSFEEDGRTFMGVPVESMALVLEGLKADAIGFNCSTGPDKMVPLVKRLHACTRLPILAKPNAGLPDPITGLYNMEESEFAALSGQLIEAGASIVGGCCGTSASYIQKLIEENKEVVPPQAVETPMEGLCSMTRPVFLDAVRVIGERINPTGKKKLQQALLEEDMDYILRQALEQIQAGADILDINVGYPGVDEVTMLPKIVQTLQSVVDVPLQLDSSNPDALAAALRIYCGKAAINSVNGKQESMDSILPLAARYGAAVVGLLLDEDGIPETVEKRLEIAHRISLQAQSLGIPKGDLWFDPLTLTVSAQPEQASRTLNALEVLHKQWGHHCVLGVSNISFGMPNRPFLSASFLLQALQAGLDLPIIDPTKAANMDAITAHRLLHEPQATPLYLERFAHTKPLSPVPGPQKQMDLQQAVLAGLKQEAARAAKILLEGKAPLEIVSDHLIPALDAAGSEFEAGRLYLPQLLSAAQAASQVFEILKQRMPQTKDALSQGTIILATVQGDVHDIGKNIVKTVLENYGFTILDLGRDVPVQTIVDACQKNQVQLVGLSALMTTTLPAMEQTVKALKALDHPPKVMVGGAVVTQSFADSIGADFYGRDASESARYAREVFA